MDTLRINGQGDINAVVDDEGNPMPTADRLDRACALEKVLRRNILFTQLDEGDTAVNGPLDSFGNGHIAKPMPVSAEI
ncbi:hypothetical protein SDC9_151194 [bioreactor metagenome]|uniref:Uncharacterized protein n=1 Tax=bioreactor metagenome TaxID=1076179 RepID=A0A645ES04_9ZZZZ